MVPFLLAHPEWLCPQNVHFLFFKYKSVKNEPILMIFGVLNPGKIWYVNSLYICPPYL